jgi:PIN domain nuclease of toxin-antitoxin system
MSLLLDTHALIWLLDGNERLGSKARALITQAARTHSLYVSAITPWEIAMLVSKERLAFTQEVGVWLRAALDVPGIQLLPLSMDISVASTQLPGDFHADPADRIIVASARQMGATLVTADKLILAYSKAGHLKTQQAES